MGEYLFTAQYLLMPAPLGGQHVSLEWFQRYTPETLPVKFDEIIQSWDTANKDGDLSDYSVCTTWGRLSRYFYLLSVNRMKMDYPRLMQRVMHLRQVEKPRYVLIEDGASGVQLYQSLRHEGVPGVVSCKAQTSKVMRLMTASPLIENGRVFLPKEAPWLAAYEHELMMFPHGRHDDQVDSTSQALNWFQEHTRQPFIIDFLKQEAERLSGAGEDDCTVLMKAPLPCIATGIRGIEYNACNTLECFVRQEDVRVLQGAGWVVV